MLVDVTILDKATCIYNDICSEIKTLFPLY